MNKEMRVLLVFVICLVNFGCDSGLREEGREFYPSGNLKSVFQIDDGELNGRCTTFYDSQKREVQFIGMMKNNLLEGPVYTFDQNGHLMIEGEYRSNKLNGIVKTYLPDGQIKKLENYKNGQKDGLIFGYNQQGSLIEVIQFKEGLQEGFFMNKTEKRWQNDKDTFEAFGDLGESYHFFSIRQLEDSLFFISEDFGEVEWFAYYLHENRYDNCDVAVERGQLVNIGDRLDVKVYDKNSYAKIGLDSGDMLDVSNSICDFMIIEARFSIPRPTSFSYIYWLDSE